MTVAVRLPSGDTITLEKVEPDIDVLKARIEAETTIPAALQELQVAGSPLTSLPDVASLTIDMIVRIGRRYAIAAAPIPAIPSTETFHPAASIERARDFERFRSQSHRLRFSDNRPLEKTANLSGSERRATARLQPYREHLDARRARLGERVARLGVETVLAMTFNAPYAALFENWDRSCQQHGIDARARTIVFPMDRESEAVAQRLGYATFADPESYGAYGQDPDVPFGDLQWTDCLFMKNAVMGDMLATGVDVLFQDVDMVWRRDPIPYLHTKAHHEHWDFMLQQAGQNAIFQPLYYNSGFVYARSNEFSRLTWDCILDNQRFCYLYKSQQAPVNIVMNTFRERGLRTCALEEALFVNGHLIPAQPQPNQRTLHPNAFVIHFNWTDGLAAKHDRLRDHGLWYLDTPAPVRDAAPRVVRSASRHGEHAQFVISHRLRCIYAAIPKNASSTIKAELRRLDPEAEGMRCSSIPEQAQQEYTTFAFLRDPLTRVLSAYQEISMRLEGKMIDKHPFTKLEPGLDRFNVFLDCIEKFPWDVHVCRQVDLLGEHRIDAWGRVETIQNDLTRVFRSLGVAPGPLPPRRSRAGRARDYGYAKHLLWKKDLPPEIVERIRTIYAPDVELLDALWPQHGGQAGRAWRMPVVRRADQP